MKSSAPAVPAAPLPDSIIPPESPGTPQAVPGATPDGLDALLQSTLAHAREARLARAGLTEIRNLIIAVAEGRQPRTGATSSPRPSPSPSTTTSPTPNPTQHAEPGEPQTLRLEPFSPSQIIRDPDISLRHPVAAPLHQALVKDHPLTAKLARLSAEDWAQITETLSAQHWIDIAGHWQALTLESSWEEGRYLLLHAVAGHGSGIRRQPGADQAMAAVLGAFAAILSRPRMRAHLHELGTWVAAHGPDRPDSTPFGPPSLPSSVDRMRWTDLSPDWFAQHWTPVLGVGATNTEAWITHGPGDIVQLATLKNCIGLFSEPGPKAQVTGPWGEAVGRLDVFSRRQAVLQRVDWSEEDLARLLNTEPATVVEEIALQAQPWGALAANTLRQGWKTDRPDLKARLILEVIRDPRTRGDAAGLAHPVVVRLVADLAQEGRRRQHLPLLQALLSRAPEIWQLMSRTEQIKILSHPVAEVRLLAIQALGEQAGPLPPGPPTPSETPRAAPPQAADKTVPSRRQR